MVLISICMFFFFKQKTAYEMRISDWSSDVCSSDLFEIRQALCLQLLEQGDQLAGVHLGEPDRHVVEYVAVAALTFAQCRLRAHLIVNVDGNLVPVHDRSISIA